MCPVDLLILSEMIYSPLEDLKGLTGLLGVLAARLGPAPDEKEEKTRLGSLHTLIGMIPSAPRYAGAQLRLFTADFSTDEEKQFAAALVSFGKTAVVVFRGTDSSLVGWKEDLNLSFESRVPSQLQAADFLNQCGELAQGFGIETLQVCGHSKGGNLALYAAAACRPEVRQLITRVISFDGPGVCAEIRDTEGYREIESRVASYIPESSVIGLLLGGTENRTVVQSDGLGIFQHNAFLWHLNGPVFETAEGTTLSSRVFAGTFQAYLEKCTVEERQSLVNFLFDLVSACGASHLGEVPGCVASHPLAAARLIRNMP